MLPQGEMTRLGSISPLLFVRVKNVCASWIKAIKDYLKGFFLYSLISHFHAERHCLDQYIMLCLFGKIIGIPHVFNYYHLRLLPFYVRRLDSWKREVLRERDFFDRIQD
jgi:hypothetical protein